MAAEPAGVWYAHGEPPCTLGATTVAAPLCPIQRSPASMSTKKWDEGAVTLERGPGTVLTTVQ
jgi:hypothetical protein